MQTLELQKIANEVRKGIVTGVHSAKAGHPGGSLSAADIFTYLYLNSSTITIHVAILNYFWYFKHILLFCFCIL